MQPDYVAIGKRLKKAREMAGFSRKEIASFIGTSASYSANIENGKKPSIEYLLVMTEKCEVSFDWIITGNEKALTCNNDDILAEIISLYEATPIDARLLLLGIVKTVIQNSIVEREKTISALDDIDGKDPKRIIHA